MILNIKLLQAGKTNVQVYQLQRLLEKEGFASNDAGGTYGAGTLTALQKWQTKQNLPNNGKVDKNTLKKLQEHWNTSGLSEVLNYSISGRLKHGQDVLAKYDVQLWERDERFDDLLGHALTDERGTFKVVFTSLQFLDDVTDFPPKIFVRILNPQGSLIKETREQAELLLPGTYRREMEADPMNEAIESGFLVFGKVAHSDGKPLEGLRVRAYDVQLGGNRTLLGKCTTQTDGKYYIFFKEEGLPSGKVLPDLQIEVMTPDGQQVVFTSSLMPDSDAITQLDIEIPNERYKGHSEWQKLTLQLRRQFPQILASSNGALTIADSVYMAKKLAIPESRLQQYRQAYDLSQPNGVKQEVWFALLRNEQPADIRAYADKKNNQLLPILQHAILNNTVDLDLAEAANQVDILIKRAIDIVYNQDHPLTKLVKMEGYAASKRLNVVQQKSLIHKYLSAKPVNKSFWSSLPNELPCTLEQAGLLEFTFELDELTQHNLPLIKAIQADGITNKRGLVGYDWQKQVLKKNIGLPSETVAAVNFTVQEYVAQLETGIAKTYPTPTFVVQLQDNHDIETLRGIKPFFEHNANFEFTGSTINRFLRDNPDALNGLSEPEILRGKLEILQRCFNVIPVYNSFTVIETLLNAGFTSAHLITRAGRVGFRRKYLKIRQNSLAKTASTQVDVVAEANTIFNKATKVALGVMLAYSKYGKRFNDTTLYALPAKSPYNVAPLNNSNNINVVPVSADWATLFGALDHEACNHCQSVYSPAAYLADLLLYLENAASTTDGDEDNFLKALMERRPDIQYILLNCKNALTEIPYIDLVIELLENEVLNCNQISKKVLLDTNNLSEVRSTLEKELQIHLDISLIELKNKGIVRGYLDSRNVIVLTQTNANKDKNKEEYQIDLHYQTNGEPDELASGPEHRNFAAYDFLKKSNAGWNLPFDLPFEETRNYLAHLGVSRYDLMKSLYKPDGLSLQKIAAEYLGIHQAELSVIVGESTLPTLQCTNNNPCNISEFLALLQISYDELEDLLQSEFVNPDKVAVKLNSTDGSKATIDASQINPDNIRRFERLRRKTKWTVIELDRVLRSLSGNHELKNYPISKATVVTVFHIHRLQDLTKVPVSILLTWWSDFDTIEYKGISSPYYQAFVAPLIYNSNVPVSVIQAFSDVPKNAIAELPDILTKEEDTFLFVPYLLGALKVSEADFWTIWEEEKTNLEKVDDKTPLSLFNLSFLFAIACFCQAANISIAGYYRLKKMMGDSSEDLPYPIRKDKGENLSTRLYSLTMRTLQFLEQIQELRKLGISIEELDYFLKDRADQGSILPPDEKGLAVLLNEMQAECRKILTENIPVFKDIKSVFQEWTTKAAIQHKDEIPAVAPEMPPSPEARKRHATLADLIDIILGQSPCYWALKIDLINHFGSLFTDKLAVIRALIFLSVEERRVFILKQLGEIVRHDMVITSADLKTKLKDYFPKDNPKLVEICLDIIERQSDLGSNKQKKFIRDFPNVFPDPDLSIAMLIDTIKIDKPEDRLTVVFEYFNVIKGETEYNSLQTECLVYLEKRMQTQLLCSQEEAKNVVLLVAGMPLTEGWGFDNILNTYIGQIMDIEEARVRFSRIDPLANPFDYQLIVQQRVHFILRQLLIKPFLADKLAGFLNVSPAAMTLLLDHYAWLSYHACDTEAYALNNEGLPPLIDGYRADLTILTCHTAQDPNNKDEIYFRFKTDNHSYRRWPDKFNQLRVNETWQIDRHLRFYQSLDIKLEEADPVQDDLLGKQTLTGSSNQSGELPFTRLGSNYSLKYALNPLRKILNVFLDSYFIQSSESPLDKPEFYQCQMKALHTLYRIAYFVQELELRPEDIPFVFEKGTVIGWLDLSALYDARASITDKPEPVILGNWQQTIRLFKAFELQKQLRRFRSGDFYFTECLTSFLEFKPSLDEKRLFVADHLHKTLGWDKKELQYLLSEKSLDISDFRDEQFLIKLAEAFGLLTRLGCSAEQLFLLAQYQPTDAAASTAKGLVRAKYNRENWLKTAAPIQNSIRTRQRDALVSYLLANESNKTKYRDINALYAYLLIDTQMDPCFRTSRIKQAIASVQLFVQRLLMNLEAENGLAFDPEEAQEWEWRKYYRVWEANRKVFLYPENWIEPELRKDKSPFFRELEEELLQGEVTNELLESAYLSYVNNLKEVNMLEIIALCYDSQESQLNIFGRTRNLPYKYFYCYFEDVKKKWTPFEKIDLDFNEDQKHFIPVVLNKRLFLFWFEFIQRTDKNIDSTVPLGIEESNQYFEIKILWSERLNGKWSGKRKSNKIISLSKLFSSDTDCCKKYKYFKLMNCNYHFTINQSQSSLSTLNFKLLSCVDLSCVDLCNDTNAIPVKNKLENGELNSLVSSLAKLTFDADTNEFSSIIVSSEQLSNEQCPSHENNITDYQNIIFNYSFTKTVLLGQQPFNSSYLFVLEKSLQQPYPFFNFSYNNIENKTIQNQFSLQFSEKEISLKNPEPEGNDYHFKDSFEFDNTIFGLYNWELFFHIPFLIACRFTQNQKFEEAQQWFHYIFNPTETDATNIPEDIKDKQFIRFWRLKPFIEAYRDKSTQQEIENWFTHPDNSLKEQLATWASDPFNPHAIAQLRTVAYMKTTVMKYLDNLIAWGDQLFRRDTIESINEATQLYILAAEILGRKPIQYKANEKPELSYYDVQNATTDSLEGHFAFPPFDDDALDGDNTSQLNTIFYFGFPPNDKLLNYWTIVEDRLFKIRHCMNIEGVVRKLALYEPPIDPALLVRAAAAGVDLSSILNDLYAPLPHYRFQYMLQKALELCNDVKALGSELLAALEKRDAEKLSLLRSTQEIQLLKLVRQIKKDNIKESEETLASTELAKETTEYQRDFYKSRERWTKHPGELASVSLSSVSMGLQLAGQALDYAAGTAYQFPSAIWGAAVYSPVALALYGGPNEGSSLSAAAKAMYALSGLANSAASLSSMISGYQRRDEEWDFQSSSADKEIKQIEKQIAAAQIRLSIAEKDLDNHEVQIEQAEEVRDFYKDKFTNAELYNWMIGQLSTLYFQAYQLAYDIAKRAERAYQHELALLEAHFIEFGYWDSLKKGLLSGERLYKDLRRMEIAYLEQNKREFELTKHISLALLDPYNLLQLRETGTCFINIPEALFDLDHPGHYLRRIKAVSLSMPCVAGPYTNVSAKLTLIGNNVRKNTDCTDGYAMKANNGDTNDSRFDFNLIGIQSIATSHAQNDSGLFELNFRDERYLPFEGAGVISSWRLELPTEFRQFDYATISDVIIHLNYTARDGGDAFKEQVNKQIQEAINNWLTAMENAKQPLALLLSLKNNFPNEWHVLQTDQNADLLLDIKHFPFMMQGWKLKIEQISIYRAGETDPVDLDNTGNTILSNFKPEIQENKPETVPISWRSEPLPKNLYVLIHYTLTGKTVPPTK